MRTKTPFILISFSLIFLMAFIPSEVIFKDDFEGHIHKAKLKRDYQVWDTGSVLNIFLEHEFVNSGKNAMGVEIVSVNPVNGSKYGSVFRTMELLMGNWSGAAGVRFWINNPNDSPLLLSFNLKERYREYWAVAEDGIFYFQDSEGTFTQQKIFYNNMPIPANFSGFVVLPFDSLEVPSWNTAKSNQVLDSNRIESYAFSIIVGEKTPYTFYIDDFEVLGSTTFYQLLITGETHLQIPASGALTATFNANLVSLGNQEVESEPVSWSIQEPFDPIISITEEGILRIPAKTQSSVITLIARQSTAEFALINTHNVVLEGADSPQPSNTPLADPTALAVEPDTAYDRISKQFDAWTTENRALFVGLLVLGVTIFLFILSFIEKRLK